MKDLILIVGEEKKQFDIKEELIENLLGSDYYDLTEEEQQKRRYLKAMINLMGDEKKISNSTDIKEDGAFYINNEDTYIMSLLKMDRVILLERKGAMVYTNKIDIKDIEDNYIILNSFADELLEKILKED